MGNANNPDYAVKTISGLSGLPRVLAAVRAKSEFLLLSIFISFLVLSYPAEARKSASGALSKMDLDGDGRLSKSEWRKKRVFGAIDRDGDGYLSYAELQSFFGEKSVSGNPDVALPDPVSLSAVRRAGFDNVQDQKNRGLFETGLKPAWPDSVQCRSIDEWFAKDYTPKRPKESYHGGIDIPAPFGTPILAAMDGKVVAIYNGEGNPRGIEVVLRHTPAETGLPLYFYTRYTHFNRMPQVKIGQRLKMGSEIGETGNSGLRGCEVSGKPCQGKSRRPAIHFDVLYSQSGKYFDTGMVLVPFNARWMDPNAMFRKKLPMDSASMRALPKAQKSVHISFMLDTGEFYPPDTNMIWPYACWKKGIEEEPTK
jgi:murein DD-endopeptidase MepM/ murein hydrolase activator NlpD